MLRKTRIFLAAIFFAGITLVFLDFTGTVQQYLGWINKIQFLPALLAVHAVAFVAFALLTLVFGRIYCSVICPLGVMQDIISRLSASRKRKHSRFRYSREKKWLRYGFLALFIVLLIAGGGALVALLDPYSAYGRIATNILAPAYAGINNLLAIASEKADSYMFYRTDIWLPSLAVLSIAIVTLVIVAVLAWRNGRTYCNTVCPVGTILGFFSRFALLRPVVDHSKCIKCGLCSHKCKASCIDPKKSEIDYSRCVTCMDCIDSCSSGAIKYRLAYGRKAAAGENLGSGSHTEAAPDNGRRLFLTTSATLLTAKALHAQTSKGDGGLADIEPKKTPEREQRILPPGAASAQHFERHCTACQLCVAQCPNNVLRPSTNTDHFMQPEMFFEKGSCRPDCVRCSEVCPAEAIKPITLAEKTSIQIGVAVWNKDLCVVNTKGVPCGLCARRCPTGAITMIPVKDNEGNDTGRAFPMINAERCIGCGACEYHCPARPYPAICVNGIEEHRHI